MPKHIHVDVYTPPVTERRNKNKTGFRFHCKTEGFVEGRGIDNNLFPPRWKMCSLTEANCMHACVCVWYNITMINSSKSIIAQVFLMLNSIVWILTRTRSAGTTAATNNIFICAYGCFSNNLKPTDKSAVITRMLTKTQHATVLSSSHSSVWAHNELCKQGYFTADVSLFPCWSLKCQPCLCFEYESKWRLTFIAVKYESM